MCMIYHLQIRRRLKVLLASSTHIMNGFVMLSKSLGGTKITIAFDTSMMRRLRMFLQLFRRIKFWRTRTRGTNMMAGRCIDMLTFGVFRVEYPIASSAVAMIARRLKMLFKSTFMGKPSIARLTKLHICHRA